MFVFLGEHPDSGVRDVFSAQEAGLPLGWASDRQPLRFPFAATTPQKKRCHLDGSFSPPAPAPAPPQTPKAPTTSCHHYPGMVTPRPRVA